MPNLVKGTIWQTIATLLKMLGGLIFIPIIVRKYNSSDVALWYLLNAGIAFANLLEFGFGPSVSRFFAYTEAKEQATFEDIAALRNRPSKVELFRTFVKIYSVLGLAVLSIAGSIGYAYFLNLQWKHELSIAPEKLWLIVIFSCTLNTFSAALNSILIGTGKFKASSILLSLPQIIYLSLGSWAALSGRNILWLVLSHFTSAFLSFLLHLFVNRKLVRESFSRQQQNKSTTPIQLMASIWPSSWRMGVVSVGAFLINQSATLLMGRHLEAREVAKYGLALQLFNAASTLSTTFSRTSLPQLSKAYAEKNTQIIKELVTLSSIISVAMFGIIAIVITFFAGTTLSLLGSSVQLPSIPILAFMSCYLLLEIIHSTFAGMITAKNNVPFLKASILSGLAIASMSWVTLRYTNLGLIGPMLAQCVVQLSYNNWYWPRKVLRDNNLDFFELKSILYSKIADMHRNEGRNQTNDL